MSDTRTDVYSRITQQIEAAIAAGAGEWRMPWHHDGLSTARPINLASNKPYRGVNVLVLWIAAQSGGYAQGLWGTYRQWLAAGAQVRRGERGTTVVLWKQATGGSDDRDNDGGEERPGRRVFARAFTVFNVAQVDGYAVSAQKAAGRARALRPRRRIHRQPRGTHDPRRGRGLLPARQGRGAPAAPLPVR